jgi:hypothetical protein
MLGQKNIHKDCLFSGSSILDCYVMTNSVSDLVHFRSGICIQKKSRYRSQEFATIGKILKLQIFLGTGGSHRGQTV